MSQVHQASNNKFVLFLTACNAMQRTIFTHYVWLSVCHWQRLNIVIFCVSRRRRKMYCGHERLCLSVCLSVCGRTPTLLHGPGCNLGTG